MRFGAIVFKIPFLIVESLSRGFVLGTKFLTKHLDAMSCREGLTKMHDEKILAIDARRKVTPWTVSTPRHAK